MSQDGFHGENMYEIIQMGVYDFQVSSHTPCLIFSSRRRGTTECNFSVLLYIINVTLIDDHAHLSNLIDVL